MGNCYSARWIKAESVSHSSGASGIIARIGGKDRDRDKDGLRLSSGSSRASSSSFPLILRTQDDILQSSNLNNLSFSDLKAATRNFRPDSVLGEGGFGSVFKGWIDETTMAPSKPGTGMAIAVKRLNQDGLQGHKEWLAEVNYLGQLYHPNLVRLVGYCLEDEQRLLVYEFMPRGSLENHLFRRGSYFQPLSWKLRMKVGLGAAKGLAYLHSAEAKVIYRDFKTSNILLDSVLDFGIAITELMNAFDINMQNYNAKLSDFGLAKDGPTGEKSHVSTRVMGTQGYAAPEYLATGHLTTKSDVYSFGVVLLEMLSGRRAIDKNRPQGEHNLVEWARPYLGHKRKIFRVLDRRIEGQYSLDGAHQVASLASQCLMMDSKLRPRMKDVVSVLEQLQEKDIEEKEQKVESVENKHKASDGRLMSRGRSLKEASDVNLCK